METTETHNRYDEVPYPDLCYTQTHPGLLAMLGQLLGMSPAPAENCRVLEIGCASGGNLLAMAAVLPNSTFVGIDYSAVQIEAAQKAAQGSGLSNITFQQMDILNITPDFGQFDYIIAHGIYSWVPPFVQEKLLEICNQNLAPQGIAYISYNTYPGWHSLDIIRNMMLYRTRNTTDPMEKSAQAREWISFIAHALGEGPNTAYAAMFENYLGYRMTQVADIDHSALLHDEMEEINMPVYFHQFVEHAEKHGLQYLVEADFPTVMPNGFSGEVMDYLGKIAQTTVEMEQYFDYLRNRTLRRTLLCHEDIEVDRRLSIQPVQRFYVSSVARVAEVSAENAARGIETFEGADNAAFSTDHPLTKAAFHCLIENRPLRVHFNDLVRQAGSRLNITQVDGRDAAALAANLLRSFARSANLIEFHSFAPQMTMTVSETPLATSLARFQTRQNPLIANLMHTRVDLDNFSRLVLANLNGKNDRAALLDFLVKLAESGQIDMQRDEDQQAPKTPDEIRHSLAAELDKTLRHLAALALLVA